MNKAAIFDLDGTLADTALDLLNAGNLTFEEMGINYRLKENLDEGISSKGGRSTIREGLLKANGYIEEENVEKLYPIFLKNYEKVIDENSKLYDGTLEMLEFLSSKKIRLGVCTNKPKKQADILLKKLGIHSFFEIIVGPDTYGCAKPNPKPLKKIIDFLGSTLNSSVLVGDTSTDYMTSQAASVPFILVLYGHGVVHQNFNTSCTPYLAKSALGMADLILKIIKKY